MFVGETFKDQRRQELKSSFTVMLFVYDVMHSRLSVVGIVTQANFTEGCVTKMLLHRGIASSSTMCAPPYSRLDLVAGKDLTITPSGMVNLAFHMYSGPFFQSCFNR